MILGTFDHHNIVMHTHTHTHTQWMKGVDVTQQQQEGVQLQRGLQASFSFCTTPKRQSMLLSGLQIKI